MRQAQAMRDPIADREGIEEERPKMMRFQTQIVPKEAVQETGYNETLHERFVAWRKLTKYPLKRIAAMLSRSEAAISQYVNRKYEGDINAIEHDIAVLLRREEELDFSDIREQGVFCITEAAKHTLEVLMFCDKTCQMGAVTGPAGIGKTETCKDYKRRNHKTILVSSDITTRTVPPLLRMIAKKMGGPSAEYRSASELLHGIIDRLRDSRRLIIIDESHFLSWESFEAIRKIHDDAGVGIVCSGMQRLYEQMKGDHDKARLYDQIYSRIAIYRNINIVTLDDVKKIADSIFPGLSGDCIDYLYKMASGSGKFRTLSKLLKNAVTRHLEYGCRMDIHLLKEAQQFLMI